MKTENRLSVVKKNIFRMIPLHILKKCVGEHQFFENTKDETPLILPSDGNLPKFTFQELCGDDNISDEEIMEVQITLGIDMSTEEIALTEINDTKDNLTSMQQFRKICFMTGKLPSELCATDRKIIDS